jgi:glycosyltransferase involved in cell wall biosynthesis
MYRGERVAIVVPAYNEAGFIGEVLQTLPAYADRAYVIDDGSTDETWNEIQHTIVSRRVDERPESSDGPEIIPIRHEHNRGVGAAIKTGYRRVRRDGLDIAVVINGDGQMDPDACHRLLEPIVAGEADYAKGNRLLAREHFEDMSAFRLFGNFLLSYLTKAASGYWKLMDPQNGYTAISARALDALDLDELCDQYGFCNDLLIRLNALGLTVADVSIEAIYGEETSTIRYHRFVPRLSGLLLSGLLWRLKTRYLLWDFHPLVVLYAAGAVGTAVGLVAGVSTLLFTATPILGTLLSVTVLVISTALLALGATFDLANNADRELRIELPDRRVRTDPPGTDRPATDRPDASEEVSTETRADPASATPRHDR